MRTSPLLLIGSASLFLATANAHAGGLPVCSAKHKRPANLYGSVLSEGLKPVMANAGGAPSKPAEAASAAPRPSDAVASPAAAAGAKPTQVSRSDLRASLAPCLGDRA